VLNFPIGFYIALHRRSGVLYNAETEPTLIFQWTRGRGVAQHAASIGIGIAFELKVINRN
jgi:hypothetical protein